MAIRLRTVNGLRVALCAAKTFSEDEDLYLDDGDHHALAVKFRRDRATEQGYEVGWEPEFDVMESEED